MSEPKSPAEQVWDAALATAKQIHARISETSSDVVCPFCLEDDFDLPGLKAHLERGWCVVYNVVETGG